MRKNLCAEWWVCQPSDRCEKHAAQTPSVRRQFYTFCQLCRRLGGPSMGTVNLLFGVQTSAQCATRACYPRREIHLGMFLRNTPEESDEFTSLLLYSGVLTFPGRNNAYFLTGFTLRLYPGRRHPGGLFPDLYPGRRHPGGLFPYGTRKEGWVYTSLLPARYTLVGIHLPTTLPCTPPWVHHTFPPPRVSTTANDGCRQ